MSESPHEETLPPRLYLTAGDVGDLMDADTAIELMRMTLADYATGTLEQLHRRELVPAGGGGALGMMPAYRGGEEPAYAAKVICVVHRPGDGPSHHGLVLLFDGATGAMLAMLDAGAVTASRTAAVTAVATDALARPDSSTLGVIGTGHQVLPHLEALARGRDLTDIRIWGRTAEAAHRVADRARQAGLPARAVGEARDAVTGSDIVVTLTPSRSPILQPEWLSPGTHINAVGASTRHGVEIAPGVVVAARVFVDDVEAASADAGDLLYAAANSAFELDQIAGTVGAVLTGQVAGRTGPEETTVFKSVGLAVQDLAAAQLLFSRARAAGRGVFVPA